MGYGDKYPVTQGGRIVGLSLMIVGIALFSVVTGTLAQWFVRSNAEKAAKNEEKVETGAEKLEQIKQLLQSQSRIYQECIERFEARIAELETQLKDHNAQK